MKFLWLFVAVCCLTACDYTEVKREIGYKGKARVNPWLAAERYAARCDREVRSLGAWTPPGVDDCVWFVPASVLGNQSFTRRMRDWVEEGGHLVLLVEHADTETNDWSENAVDPRLEPALLGMLKRMGIDLKEAGKSEKQVSATQVQFAGRSFEVSANSKCGVSVRGGAPGVFASVKRGDGQLTVITDARIFRNRWIGDKEHAALLDALIQRIGVRRLRRLSAWLRTLAVGAAGKPSVAGVGRAWHAGLALVVEKSHPLRPGGIRRRGFHAAGLRASSGGARRFPMAA